MSEQALAKPTALQTGRRATVAADVTNPPSALPRPGPVELANTWQVVLMAAHLPAAELQALSAIAQVRSLPAQAQVFGHQQISQSLTLLHQGTVALGLCTADGLFRIERNVQAPGWLDQGSAWLGRAHAMDAQTRTPCTVLELPLLPLRELLRTRAPLAERLICSLALEVQSLAANTHELMHKDAPARLAAWLVQRCTPLGEDGQRAVLHLQGRKRDLAAQLAITPETLSRLMRSFTRQGVMEVTGYTVNVLNLPELRRLAA